MVSGADIKDAVRIKDAVVQDDISLDRRWISEIDAEKPPEKRKDQETAGTRGQVYNWKVDQEKRQKRLQKTGVRSLGS